MILTIVLAGMLLVCGGGGVGVVFWLRANEGVPDSQPTAAVGVFLDAVFGPSASQAKVDALICAGSGTQIANRISMLKPPDATGLTVNWSGLTQSMWSKKSANVTANGSISGTLTTNGEPTTKAERWSFRMAVENETWKVCTWV